MVRNSIRRPAETETGFNPVKAEIRGWVVRRSFAASACVRLLCFNRRCTCNVSLAFINSCSESARPISANTLPLPFSIILLMSFVPSFGWRERSAPVSISHGSNQFHVSVWQRRVLITTLTIELTKPSFQTPALLQRGSSSRSANATLGWNDERSWLI